MKLVTFIVYSLLWVTFVTRYHCDMISCKKCMSEHGNKCERSSNKEQVVKNVGFYGLV